MINSEIMVKTLLKTSCSTDIKPVSTGPECQMIWSIGTSSTTLRNQAKPRMETNMSSINEHGTGVPIGLRRRLPPWELAAKLLPINGGAVKLKDATDSQFQAFVASTGMRIRDNGIAEWSFDDRIRFVNF